MTSPTRFRDLVFALAFAMLLAAGLALARPQAVPIAVAVLIWFLIDAMAEAMQRAAPRAPWWALLALAVWGTLWGPAGMFLAIPIMVILTIVLAAFPATRPIAIALSRD